MSTKPLDPSPVMTGKPTGFTPNVAVWKTSSRLGFYFKLEGDIRKAISDFPKKYQRMTARLIEANFAANVTDKALRLAFWREYNHAIEFNTKVNDHLIIAGICNDVYWEEVLKNKHKLAYILTPVRSWEIRFREVEHDAVDKLAYAVDRLPIQDQDGKFILRNLKELRECLLLVQNRLHGAPVARTLTKDLDKPAQPPSAKPTENLTAEQLQAKIDLLRAQNNIPGPGIDVIELKPPTEEDPK